MMQRIKSIDFATAMVYGAVLAAMWTFVFGVVAWLIGWIWGAESVIIDMNLWNWTEYTLSTFLSVVWKALVNGLSGAFSGFVFALVYNIVAGIMGGFKIELVPERDK